MLVLFIVLAIIALLLWGMRRSRPKKSTPSRSPALLAASAAAAPATAATDTPADNAPSVSSDVEFRMRGERGAGGPIFGDVLCGDGVYLPQVWESDFHTSFDGRWIRTGSYSDSIPRLLDRKSRRSWLLSVVEAGWVDDLHWRLPRWNGESQGGNGVAAEGNNVLSDNVFETWLAKHVGAKAQALIAVCDLWIPADCVPAEVQALPPELPQQENAAVQVTVQRHWPASLRGLDNPLEPLQHPYWQLQLNGDTHSWIMDANCSLVWRADGQAFACYGYPVSEDVRKLGVRLGVWSVTYGGQQWSEWLPEDHKPWSVRADIEASAEGGLPALLWDGDELLQRMQMDTPELERLHDGRSLSSAAADVYLPSKHREDGRVLLKKIPLRHFFWRRNLHNPKHWVAQSEPVAGMPLQWTLMQEAAEETGATAAYSVQSGEHQLPGLWELEHVVVDGQWAVLCPWGTSPLQGGKPMPWVWDGKQLNALDTHWPVLRMRPHVLPGQAQLLMVVGCGPDNSNLASTGLWRWPLQVADATNLTKNAWTPAYEWRDIAVDAQGAWQLLPRWREVQQVQHPCADGDYVWRSASARDAIWWWGGLHNQMDNHWRPKAARCEGVLVTQSGAVLCGVGPSACPHHAGDGWLVVEWLARGTNNEPHHWKLHWLRPHKHEMWTMELRAYMPVLQAWDAQQGVQWMDVEVPPLEEGGALQTAQHVIAPMRWEGAQLDVLKQSPVGLWMRKQDAVYADAIALRDDWPWKREATQAKSAQT